MMAAAEDQASVTRLAPLDEACLPAAQALSAHFGWPHRVEDWRWALALGEGFGAFDGGQPDGGQLVGTGLCWRFGKAASLGLVVVAPAAQGRGLGRRITSALLGRIGEAPVVLHATEAGLPLYASLGFVAEGTVCQYQGTPGPIGPASLPAGARLRPLGLPDLAAVTALDAAAARMDRRHLHAALLEGAGGIGLDRDGVLLGFAFLRRFGRGQLIGPVVAVEHEGARAMIAHLLGSQAGRFVRIDIPEESGLAPWLAELGLADAGPAIRMVRGTLPDRRTSAAATFALASQAIG